MILEGKKLEAKDFHNFGGIIIFDLIKKFNLLSFSFLFHQLQFIQRQTDYCLNKSIFKANSKRIGRGLQTCKWRHQVDHGRQIAIGDQIVDMSKG